MELGNMMFGNSRGEYEVPRTSGWEEESERLFDSYSDSKDNSYGVNFENETFSVFTYYWGDCTCGYDHREAEWSLLNSHNKGCYQDKLKDDINYFLQLNPEPLAQMWNTSYEEVGDGVTMISSEPAISPRADTRRQWYAKKREYEDKVYDKLCKEFGLDRKYGCAVHCTCDYGERWEKFLLESWHKNDCLTIKPNFLFKPNGFEIQWYKYPLRDAYMNQNITLEEFRKIVLDCINSLGLEIK